MDSLIGKGVYSIAEAARFAQVNTRTAHRWIAGSPTRGESGVIRTDIPVVDHRHALSFLDLIDLLVVGRFRDASVSLQTIRRVYAHLVDDLQTDHPFCRRELLTDGRNVFMATIDQVGDARLEEVLTGQHAMPSILLPYLERIDYSPASRIAARWRIATGVVLDPALSFGRPVIADGGATTYALAQAYLANGRDEDLVADLYDVSTTAVLQAVAFEEDYFPGRAA